MTLTPPAAGQRGVSSPSVDFRWAAIAGFVCALAVILVPAKADPDLWGHLRFGLDSLRDGALAVDDPYSFTQDRPQVYHEWLGAVLLGLAYEAAGVPGILVLKASIAFAILGVMLGWLRRLNASYAFLLASLAAVNLLPLSLVTRPQIWTALAMVTLVRLLLDGRYLWILPLFAIWANLHGGWVMGLGVLGVWCAAFVVDTWWRTCRVTWLLLFLPVGALAATLLTPYGWDLWQFLGETLRVDRRDITEWRPLWRALDYKVAPAALTATLFVVTCFRRATRPSWPWVVTGLVFIYSGIRVSRLVPISALVLTLLMVAQLARSQRTSQWRLELPSRAAAILMMLPLATVFVAAFYSLAGSVRCMPIIGGWAQDAAAIPVLRQAIDGGRVVTYFDWGQYALWHLGPRLKVSIDGRRETIYSDRMLAIQRAVFQNLPAGHQWLLDVRPEYVWLKAAHQPRKQWLLEHGYRVDWESDKSYVAVRADLPVISGPTTIETSGCFPGP
jgi:hypothetical protein